MKLVFRYQVTSSLSPLVDQCGVEACTIDQTVVEGKVRCSTLNASIDLSARNNGCICRLRVQNMHSPPRTHPPTPPPRCFQSHQSPSDSEQAPVTGNQSKLQEVSKTPLAGWLSRPLSKHAWTQTTMIVFNGPTHSQNLYRIFALLYGA